MNDNPYYRRLAELQRVEPLKDVLVALGKKPSNKNACLAAKLLGENIDD